MRTFLIILGLTGCFGMTTESANGQIVSDSISFVKTNFGYQLYQGPMQIGPNRMQSLTEHCDDVWQRFEGGRKTEGLGTVFILSGVLCLGTAFGNHIFSEEPFESTPLIIAGAGFIAVGIPIHSSGIKKVKASVLQYNLECLKR